MAWARRLVALALVAAPVGALAGHEASGAATPEPQDALVRRVRSELAAFTGWLTQGGARGYIGEVGWPDDRAGDADAWNALAEHWYRDADASGLSVTAWATGDWWDDYPLAVFQASRPGMGVDTPSTQASVVAGHPSTPGVWRGVNVAGGEFAAPSTAPTSTFSNRNPGVYDVAYHYDPQATFTYLATRGVQVVRIPFRWERLQPTLGRPLDAAELQRLRAVVGRAGAAGLKVILDLHNYGGYYHDRSGVGTRGALGSAATPRAAFAELWGRISLNFQNDTAVLGYGLMNEPTAMPGVNGATPARTWELASQDAVKRIRSNADRKLVFVAGYDWSSAARWAANHPRPWIVDGAGKTVYEAHHYWDRDGSGTYARRYADEVADAASRGY